MRIIVRGSYNTQTGYGSDVVGLCAALARHGHDVHTLPVSVVPPIPRDIALLMAKSVPETFDLAVLHQPPFDLIAPKGTRARSRKVVGWTMWEQTRFLPEHWIQKFEDGSTIDRLQNVHTRYPWRDFDLIVGYDQISVEAMTDYDPEPKYAVLQGGMDVARWNYIDDRDWHGTFRFAMLGELHQRKDPWIAIEAFRELQAEGMIPDAELHLKTSVPGLHPDIAKVIPNVFVHASWWSREQIQEFYRDVHCALAPSRGEGKNLPPLEMQLTGAVAIATNWGGHQNWAHPSYSFPLDYRLMEIGDSGSFNARASKEHLKQLMVKAYENREECRRMGKIASGAIHSQFSWDRIAAEFVRLAMEDT